MAGTDYLPFDGAGGLLPLPPPEGFPVVLGPLGGRPPPPPLPPPLPLFCTGAVTVVLIAFMVISSFRDGGIAVLSETMRLSAKPAADGHEELFLH